MQSNTNYRVSPPPLTFPTEALQQFVELQYTHLQLSGYPPKMQYLVPPHDIPPLDLQDPIIYQYGDIPSPSFPESLPPSPLYESPSELPDSQACPPPQPIKRLRSGNRVPRPRNAFMIFRSEFWAEEKITKSIEHDHRHISRIIGHCWNQLPEEKKEVWRHKAQKEKEEHALRYPGYRFSPAVRLKKPVKRNVKRNGKEELLRCKKVAELLLAGKAGEELNTAVKRLGPPTKDKGTEDMTKSATASPELVSPESNESEHDDHIPIFRSPLLPPATSRDHVPPIQNNQPQSPAPLYRESTPLTALKINQFSPTYYEGASCQSLNYAPRLQFNQWSTSPTPSRGAASYTQYGNSTLLADNYTLQPTSSLSDIRFTNPFNYSAPIPFANCPPTPLDPLHWDISRLG